MKKGQYFSADIIVAIIIFIFSLSLLINYWNALKTQSNFQQDFLYSEAIRISDLLLTPGDYNVSGKSILKNGLMYWWTWYDDPDNAIKAGFGVEGLKNKVVYATNAFPEPPNINSPKLKLYTNSADPEYIKLKTLFGTYLDFYINFSLYLSSSFSSNNQPPPALKKEIGLKLPPPTSKTQIAKVRRIVYAYYTLGSASRPLVASPQYIGYMDVYIWKNNY